MKNLLIILSLFALTSCARSCQKWERSTFDNRSQNIRITQYSGGKEIGKWEFNGIINSSEHSDGYYFYYNGSLIEISGDIKIEYLK